MKGKVMLRKTIVALTVAFALGGSALPTSAFAIAGAGNADHADRVSNLHRAHPNHGHGYQWDPWGHWGGYYGPMI